MPRNSSVPETKSAQIPVQKPNFLPNRATTKLRATWLGHACYYIEFPNGLRVLCDPVFSQRCSPLSWLGPKRYTRTPCDIKDIPIIDAVIISHNHYDHLDYPTIMEIFTQHPAVHFFVPLGNEKWFRDCGILNVTELDWWEECDFEPAPDSSSEANTAQSQAMAQEDSSNLKTRIGCLPSQHVSARTGFDKQQTLWASWSIEGGSQKVWFGGDTGYRAVPELPEGEDDYAANYDFPHCPAFEQIGTHRGPFDLGLIPIGAYAPRFIMSSMHVNPFDSVNVFLDTKCQRAMGIHWGTWVLTGEDILEPPEKLKAALASKGLPTEGLFDVCHIGESREFP